MKYLIAILLIGSLSVPVSCSKDGSSGPSNTELIVSAAWKYDNAGVDVNADGFIDAAVPVGYVGDCGKDNILTFKNDGTGTLDEGTNNCDPSGPQTSSFTWMFKNGETVINFSAPVFLGISGDVKILKLTSTELDLSKEVNTGAPVPINIVIELKH